MMKLALAGVSSLALIFGGCAGPISTSTGTTTPVVSTGLTFSQVAQDALLFCAGFCTITPTLATMSQLLLAAYGNSADQLNEQTAQQAAQIFCNGVTGKTTTASLARKAVRIVRKAPAPIGDGKFNYGTATVNGKTIVLIGTPAGMKPRATAWYGYRRDGIDRRDHIFDHAAVASIPAAVDLRAHCPPVMNQQDIGSCTAHGITAVIRYAMIRAGQADRPLSRLQLYYDERVIEGTVDSDAGAEIRDGIKSAAAAGVAPEPLWPYNETRFRQKPSANVYAGALKFRALTYQRVGNPDGTATAAQIKAAIAAGFPVVGGFNVFAQFESDQCAKDGVVTIPTSSDQPIGGHCTYFPAYGQRPGTITGRNSWDTDWGDKGDFYVPEAFLEQQGSDFWVITKVGLS